MFFNIGKEFLRFHHGIIISEILCTTKELDAMSAKADEKKSLAELNKNLLFTLLT